MTSGRLRGLFAGLAAVFVSACPASGSDDYFDLTLESLMQVQVTTVSKASENYFRAPAAVHVLKNEDLKRSGVRSLSEALRMVPGLHVGRIDGNTWNITARGFPGRFANKLLVLVDGRSVYTPLFSGVYWDAQDIPLETIDRIEVVRGPGGTLWGANAVNGVINVITKTAGRSRGTVATVGAGSEERLFGEASYGSKLPGGPDYRIHAKYADRDPQDHPDGAAAGDDLQTYRGGFRMDWSGWRDSSLMLSGDIYRGTEGRAANVPTLERPFVEFREEEATFSGGYLVGRWERYSAGNGRFMVQAYYDRTDREDELLIDEKRDTIDLELQHGFQLGESHRLTWGLGYRLTADETEPGAIAGSRDESRTDRLYHAFLMAEWSPLGGRIHVHVGSKVEHNDYTGLEIQPSVRFSYAVREDQTIWASVSRAVRTPSRGEADGAIIGDVYPPLSPRNPTILPAVVMLTGSRHFDSEDLLALELGYRALPMQGLLVDVAVFLNRYDKLRSLSLGSVSLDPGLLALVVPAVFDNEMEGETYGIEMAGEWKPAPGFRFQGAYTFFGASMETKEELPLDRDVALFVEDGSPRHQVSLRASLDLSRDWELDMWFRYVGEISSEPIDDVDAYGTLDVRVGWKPLPGWEFALVGQNLLAPRHGEAANEGGAGGIPTEVERGFYVSATGRF